MMKFHALVRENAQELAELIVMENGKNITEALADGKNFCRSMFRYERSLVKDSFSNTVICHLPCISIFLHSRQRK
jgi:acyl-CoA reductase-like NAD-dependent aldehyde dehydrogenase